MKKKSFFLFVCVIAILFIISACASTTPLIKASKAGDSSAVEQLINEGANINEPDSRGYTPLIHAIWSKKTEMVKVLINKGADVNAKDTNGYTPLLWAASYGHLDIAKLLIDKGANVNAIASDRSTPYSLAMEANNTELVNLLVSKGADMKSADSSALILAVRQCNTELAKKLIQSGADINAKNSENENVLDLALYSAQGDIVDAIIRTGINLWKPEPGKARVFFVGRGLYDYLKVTVGKQGKKLNDYWSPDKGAGVAFIDVNPGTHMIDANFDQYVSSKRISLDVIAGQTYYFRVAQNMKTRVLSYVVVVRPLSESITGNPFPITPLVATEGKQEIINVLKSKELSR